MPSAGESTQRWWAHRMRASATPSTVRALMDMNSLVDVRDALPAVRVPTLVLHRRGDALFDMAEGKYIADRVAGAQFVVLDGEDHFVAGDPDQILDAVEPFVSSTPRRVLDLTLAAVVFPADPNASAVARSLITAGGRRRHTAAGDIVVLFDGPATGVRAGMAALETAPHAALGLSIAEVTAGGGPVSGPEVDRAVALGSAARPGELVVSPTAGVLLSSAAIELEPLSDGSGALRAVRG